MPRVLFLFAACAACTAEEVITTTPAQLTVHIPATPNLTAHEVTRSYSAFALVSDQQETVVFTTAPPGTDCAELGVDGEALLSVSGEQPGSFAWHVDTGDGVTTVTTNTVSYDLVETGISGFYDGVGILDGGELPLSISFAAPFCYERWSPS